MKYNKIILTAIMVFSLNLQASEIEDDSILGKLKSIAYEYIDEAKEGLYNMDMDDITNKISSFTDSNSSNEDNESSKGIISNLLDSDSNDTTANTIKEIGSGLFDKLKELY